MNEEAPVAAKESYENYWKSKEKNGKLLNEISEQ